MQRHITEYHWHVELMMTNYKKRLSDRIAVPRPKGDMLTVYESSFPKDGKTSVGFYRQYYGNLGKVANCQVTPSEAVSIIATDLHLEWKKVKIAEDSHLKRVDRPLSNL